MQRTTRLRLCSMPGVSGAGSLLQSVRHTTRTTTTLASKLQRRLIGGLLFGVVLTACVGCQTFSLSDEGFQKQQRGETVDRETGEAVGVVGTLGCYGAIVGGAVAESLRR